MGKRPNTQWSFDNTARLEYTVSHMSDEQAVAGKVQEELYTDPIFREMVEAGLFFGRKRSRTNPRMRPYILTNRNEIEIINLTKTQESLDNALAFIKERVTKGGIPLFVGTQPPAAESVRALATEFGFPFVVTRWLGGTLTNFRIISARIEYYKKQKADSARGAFEKYTKKEKLDLEREIERLTETLGGLEPMTRVPDFMIVIDPNLHMTAVREARRMKMPIVSFVNTDCDPDMINQLVAGNTKARLSINWFLDKVKETIAVARKDYEAAKAAAAAASANAAASAAQVAAAKAASASSAAVSSEPKK
jgi:small subunit ribosomal protein S2